MREMDKKEKLMEEEMGDLVFDYNKENMKIKKGKTLN